MRSTESTSTPVAVRRRRRFSKEFKRQAVEETLVRGASVSAVALRHRLNANQVFNWRRKYLRETALAPTKAVKMLPVTIEAASVLQPVPKPSQGLARRSTSSRPRGSIEIEYAGATIRVRGVAANRGSPDQPHPRIASLGCWRAPPNRRANRRVS